MPTSLNARFSADFSELEKAVAAADVHIQTFEKASNRAASEISKMASSFRGDAIIRDATLAAKAVEAIGGASKLTTADAQKLLTTTTVAMDALKRQGADVPASLAKISAELKGVNDVGTLSRAIGGLKDLGGQAGPAGAAVESLAGRFTSLGTSAGVLGPIGIAVAAVAAAAVGLAAVGYEAVTSLAGLISHAANAGDEMLTLSNKTKVSVEGLSQFKYIGEQTGTSLEDLTGAVFKMSANLGKGSEESQRAIKQLGLSFVELKNQRPEDAFVQVIEALSHIGNTAKQQAEGVAIFGKGFKEVSQLTKEDIPGMIQRFKDLGGGVTTEMALAGDAVHDAMSDISTAFEGVRLKIGSAFLPTIAAVLKTFGDAWIEASKVAGLSYVSFAQTVETVSAVIVQFIGTTILVIADFIRSVGSMARGLDAIGEKAADLSKWLPISDAAVNAFSETVNDSGNVLHDVAGSADKLADVAKNLGLTLALTTSESLGKTREALIKAADAARSTHQGFSDLSDSTEQTKDKIKSLGDELAKTIEQARKSAVDFETGRVSLANLGAKQEEVNKLFVSASEAMRAMGRAGDPLYSTFTRLAFATANWSKEFQPLKLGIEDVLKELNKLPDATAKTEIALGSYAKMVSTIPNAALGFKEITKQVQSADDAFQTSLKKTSDAYHAFGLTSRAELQQAAIAAQENFSLLLASGTATTHQLTEAYQQMIAAQRAATGQLPTLWESILPEIKNSILSIRDTMNDSVAQMVLGMKSLSDGWSAIWQSMKETAAKILADILEYFERKFILGILDALTNAGGGWSQAFSGIINGGNGGGGGAGGGIAGGLVQRGENAAGKWALNALGLGGAGASAIPVTTGFVAPVAGEIGITTGAEAGLGAGASTIGGTAATAGTTQAGTTAASTSGTFGGLSAGLLGGAAAGGAGLGLGLLGTKIFGGAGWKASGFGAGTGAATGALIGSVVPGLGTAIGAGIGALAGLIGGWIGKSVGEKVNDARDAFTKQFGGTGTGAGSGFGNLAAEAQELNKIGIDGQKIFKDLFKADSFDELNKAVKKWTDALSSVPYASLKIQESFDALQQQQQALIDAGTAQTDVLTQQAGDYSQLFDTIVKSGAAVPAGLEPILQKLVDMGLLVDANGAKVENLDALIRKTAESSSSGIGDMNDSLIDLVKGLDETTRRALLNSEAWQDVLFNGKKVGPEIEQSLLDAANAAGLTADQINQLVQALGTDIPDAAQSATDALEHMPRRYDFDVNFNRHYTGEDISEVPPTATGGIVTRPQVRLVGEAGPEAIIPLNRMASAGPTQQRIVVQLDRRTLLDVLVPGMPAYLDLKGAAR
jgi:hypothetical protein